MTTIRERQWYENERTEVTDETATAYKGIGKWDAGMEAMTKLHILDIQTSVSLLFWGGERVPNLRDHG